MVIQFYQHHLWKRDCPFHIEYVHMNIFNMFIFHVEIWQRCHISILAPLSNISWLCTQGAQNAVNRSYVHLILSGSLVSHSPCLLLLSVMELLLQCSGCSEEERRCISCILQSWGSPAFTHWLFLSTVGGITSLSFSPLLCHLGTDMMLVKSRFSLYAFQYIKTLSLFCFSSLMVCWDFSSGNLNFHKGLLVRWWPLTWVFCSPSQIIASSG